MDTGRIIAARADVKDRVRRLRTRLGQRDGNVRRSSSVQRRLLSALALPIIAVTVVSGLQVRTADREARSTRTEAGIALAAGGPGTLITALLDERNISGLELLAMGDAADLRVESSAAARPITDARLAALSEAVASGPAQVRDLYADVLDQVRRDLAVARSSMDEFDGERSPTNPHADVVYEQYSDLLGTFHTANDRAIREIGDADLRNRARSIADQSRISDLTSQLARTIAVAQLDGEVTSEEILSATEVAVRRDEASGRAVRELSGDPRTAEVVSTYLQRPEWQELDGLITTFALTGQAGLLEVVALAGADAEPNAATAWEATRASLQERADEMISASASSRDTAVLVFGVSVLLALAIALWAARSISRPLLALAGEAESMSRQRLPDALAGVLATELGEDIEVPVLPALQRSPLAEVDAVAVALNTVQDRALALAVEQAAMRHNTSDSLVSLGRRVQGLVGRQLEHITELEETEADPDALAALYNLDHLATRVRRNAESLVVLAGHSRTQRRTNFGRPESVVDVVRSAIAEVESFDRVDLDGVQQAKISAQVANDVSHILAELIENGLSFSPPSTRVTVAGHALPMGYRFTVADSGLGMDEEALARANLRLAGGESFTVAPSKYLGHYVTGHLARRHGITVTLGANHAGGVTALVAVPESLLSEVVQLPPTEADGPTDESSPTGHFAAVLGANRDLHELVTARRSVDESITRIPVRTT